MSRINADPPYTEDPRVGKIRIKRLGSAKPIIHNMDTSSRSLSCPSQVSTASLLGLTQWSHDKCPENGLFKRDMSENLSPHLHHLSNPFSYACLQGEIRSFRWREASPKRRTFRYLKQRAVLLESICRQVGNGERWVHHCHNPSMAAAINNRYMAS